MPSRLHPLLAALAGAILLAGCTSTSSTHRKTAPVSPAAVSSRTNAVSVPTDDYSPAAVEKRVEAHARYTAALLHELSDEPEEAAKDFYKAALADPGNSELVQETTARLLQLRKYDDALNLLQKAIAVRGSSGELHARLGVVYALLDKPTQAVMACRDAIQNSPDEIVGYQVLAQIYFKKNQTTEGFAVLDEARRQKKVEAGFLVELAQMYIVFGRANTNQTYKATALSLLERAAELNPTEPMLVQKLGQGFDVLGQPEKAALFYVKLLEKYPNLPELRERLVRIYLGKSDHAKATEQLEALLRRNPTNPQIYLLLGSVKFEEKKPKEAEDYFRRALLLAPDLEPVYYDLAAAQINQDHPREALDTLSKARDKFKARFITEFYTALAYSRMKEYTNAIKFMTAAEVVANVNETNRLTHLFYFQLGATYERTKQISEAEKYFRKALDMAPDFPEALNYLGYMWAERNVNLDEARQLLERAVKAEPKNGAYLDSLGWVYYKLGRVQDALRLIQEAIRNTEEPDGTLYDHLGDIYNTLNQPEKAREAWRKALTFDSVDDKAPIRKKLEESTSGGLSR